MAPCHATCCQPGAAHGAMRTNRFGGVLRARRVKSTGNGKKGRENSAINGDRKEQNGYGNTVAGSVHLIVTSFGDQSINVSAGNPAAASVRSMSAVASLEVIDGSDPLAIRTTHRSGSFHLPAIARAASRKSRFARLRLTAPPTLLLATTPMRSPSPSGFV